MIVFPNCKINLGLHILRKRNDGYHDIETVFFPVAVSDILEIVERKQRGATVHLTTSGIPVNGKPKNNLCVKAYKLLQKDFPSLPSVLIHLHKVIPSGAGLGGGSSDAAYTLLQLNQLGNLGLSQEKLIEYALQLGSDCPFFIINKPSYGTGQGEILEEFPVDLSGYKILLVNPGIHVDTGKAFSSIKPAIPDVSVKVVLKSPVTEWKDNLFNDFETVVFPKYNEIAAIKKELYTLGAVYASMSGSGSTVYGIFEINKKIDHHFPTGYFVRESFC